MAQLAEIAEQYLRGGASVFGGQGRHRGMGQNIGIGGQGPKCLIDDTLLPTEVANGPIISGFGIKAVLQHGGLDPRRLEQMTQLGQIIAIADPQLPGSALVEKAFHGLPNLAHFHGIGQWRMQHQAVHDHLPQIGLGPFEGLRHLTGQRHRRIIGYTLRILTGQRRKFGLHVEIGAVDRSRPQSRPHPGFVVMLGLTGGIDAAKAQSQGLTDQIRSPLLLPGGAIDDPGHAHPIE